MRDNQETTVYNTKQKVVKNEGTVERVVRYKGDNAIRLYFRNGWATVDLSPYITGRRDGSVNQSHGLECLLQELDGEQSFRVPVGDLRALTNVCHFFTHMTYHQASDLSNDLLNVLWTLGADLE